MAEPLSVAKSTEELFDAYAARIAEILRERHGLEPEPLLRVSRTRLTAEGLVGASPDGHQLWHVVRSTPEELDWSGPEASAESFVRAFIAARATRR